MDKRSLCGKSQLVGKQFNLQIFNSMKILKPHKILLIIAALDPLSFARQEKEFKINKKKMKRLKIGKSLFLIFMLSCMVSLTQENRSKVGIRPYPRDSVHKMTGGDRVANWKPGIGNYDAMLKADDYTALHMDVVKGYNCVFKTKNGFLSITSISREENG